MAEHDRVNSPNWYKMGNYELMDVMETWGLNRDHHLASAIQYIFRSNHKNETTAGEVEDLEKARWYINRAIEYRKTCSG